MLDYQGLRSLFGFRSVYDFAEAHRGWVEKSLEEEILSRDISGRRALLSGARKADHRIIGGTYEWVEDRHVLAVSTPAEIPLLLDVMVACYIRLSDECLYEVQILQEIAKRIGRSRCRAKVGMCKN